MSLIPQFNNITLAEVTSKVMKKQEEEINIEVSKSEYIFFLDRSASMAVARINKATIALMIFIKSLPEDSYFNVISFGSYFHCMFPQSVKNESSKIKLALA